MANILFTAHATVGSGRGKTIGFPTINIELEDVPDKLEHGIYVGLVTFQGAKNVPAAIHYGHRIFFNDTEAFEIHLIDKRPDALPERVTIEIVERLRDVRDFPSEEDLKQQITQDVSRARDMLSKQ